MFYPIYVAPSTKEVSLHRTDKFSVEVLPKLSDGSDGRWRWGKDTTAQRLIDLVGGTVGTEQRWDIFQVDYAETEGGAKRIKPKTIWTGSEFANEAGTLELKRLFGKAPFDTAKPLGLLRYCIEQVADPEAIVLDFFAGSGTTGHAVFEANAEGNGKRRFVLVQLPEALTGRDYGTIADITKERLRRAANAVKEESPLFSGDLGFRVFKLHTSNIRAWEPNRDDIINTLDDAAEHLRADRTEEDILFELLLKLGLDLTVPIEKKTIAGKTVHSIGAGVLMVCLDKKIGAKEVEPLAHGIADWHKKLAPAGETTIVFRDSAFADDVAKTNVTAILQQHGLDNVRSL